MPLSATPNPQEGGLFMDGSILIAARISAQRHREITEAANKCGMSLAAYVRQAVYAAVDKQKENKQ